MGHTHAEVLPVFAALYVVFVVVGKNDGCGILKEVFGGPNGGKCRNVGLRTRKNKHVKIDFDLDLFRGMACLYLFCVSVCCWPHARPCAALTSRLRSTGRNTDRAALASTTASHLVYLLSIDALTMLDRALS